MLSWFLDIRLYRGKDGSYIIDQKPYTKHILNRHCEKESPWGIPPMKTTPAPIDYVYSKANQLSNEEGDNDKLISSRYPNLSKSSTVSSLLYIALNSRSDILWIVDNKLAKSSSKSGLKDYKALIHYFRYLQKFPSIRIYFCADVKEYPVFEVYQRSKVKYTDLVVFSELFWQNCPDTGRSTCG